MRSKNPPKVASPNFWLAALQSADIRARWAAPAAFLSAITLAGWTAHAALKSGIARVRCAVLATPEICNR